MQFHRLRRAGVRAGALATLIALIGAAALPIATATEEQHCAFVVIDRLPDGQLITADPVCFDTLAEAVAFGTDGRVNLPAGITGADLLAAQALTASTGVAFDPLAASFDQPQGGPTAIHFKGYDGTGSSASVYNVDCAGDWWYVTGAFDNSIRSTYNPCGTTVHYDGEGLTGSTHRTYGAGTRDNLYGFADRTNSVAYHS